MARGKEKVQGKEAGREDTRVKEEEHKRRRPRQDEALGKKESQIKEEARVKEEGKFKKDVQGKDVQIVSAGSSCFLLVSCTLLLWIPFCNQKAQGEDTLT